MQQVAAAPIAFVREETGEILSAPLAAMVMAIRVVATPPEEGR